MANLKSDTQSKPKSKRQYLKQADVPATSIGEALRIPRAIIDNYAGEPTSPIHVAKALHMDPTGSQLRLLSGAAIAFGLVEGGAQASTISVTPLAQSIIRPKEEGADLLAKREALLKPRVFGEFLRKYDQHPFPRTDIAINVLEDMGVPRDKTEEVLERIEESAQEVGFLETVKDKKYVMLQGTVSENPDIRNGSELEHRTPAAEEVYNEVLDDTDSSAMELENEISTAPPATDTVDQRKRLVFVTHGKNRNLVDPIKKLLEYGELQPVVSVERQSVSKPVPQKVLDDMRKCGAAIIHVDTDQTITDTEGNTHEILSPNVLIEIGAAMAFYGSRFILLVRDGIRLPSNLQGLYEVRYSGETLDADATIKLLEAIKDIKNYALPPKVQTEPELKAA